MKQHLSKFSGSSLFVLYTIGFIFTFCIAVPSYISSSFLSHLIGEKYLGLVYVIGSFFIVLIFLVIPRFLRRYGNYKITIVFSIINLLTLSFLTFFNNIYLLVASFIVTGASAAMLGFCLDIFIEHDSSNSATGNIRGVYLTWLNIAWLISPFLSGVLVGVDDYSRVFFVSTAIMIPVLLMVSYNLKDFKDREYKKFNFIATFKQMWKRIDVRCIMIVYFLLQFFFALMVIYIPIYLNTYIGFDWLTIGKIFTIMLLPFVLLQVSLGKLADQRYGEKEMLSIGFIIMAISVAFIPLLADKNFWIWAILLFTTRIGAAMVQVMSDTYFFKNIGEKDVNFISIYRMSASLAYIVAPALATVFLLRFGLGSLFFLLGFLMLFGLRYSLAIKDTR